MSKGLKINRYFTEEGKDVYDMFEYVKGQSTLRNPDGSVVFEMKDLEIPKSWSQLATDILAQKYIRKAGVPQKDGSLGAENSIKQVAHRLAGCWRYWGEKYDYFGSEKDAQAFYDECVYMIISQSFAPNSPQWFNTGLAFAYNIRGEPQGHYYVDPETDELKKSEDAYTRPQPHACADYHTQIYTEEGTKFIGEIVEQDFTGLKIFDGEKYVKVLATQYNGEKEVFKITLKNGNYIELTTDHLVLSSEKRKKDGGSYDWHEVGDLNIGMKVQQPLLLDIKEKNVFSDDLAKARLAGWIIGDGSVGIYQNVMRLEVITVNDDEHEAVLNDIKEVFGEDVSYWENSFETISENLEGKRIHLAGKKIHSFVEEYDLLKRSKTVVVPKKVLEASPQEKREFLKALFQADGGVRIRKDESDNRNSGDICLTTISEELSFGVLQLLNSLGIYARISQCRDSRSNREIANQVIIAYGSAREQYQEQISFISDEKQQKLLLLNKLVSNSKTLPLIREETIVSIESKGIRKVYDIQTESGKFLGNGVVIHNCFIQSVSDDLVNEGGIFDLAVREARVFKYGSGSGSNFSAIRGKGEKLSGGGSSSGLMSFLKIFDVGAGAIKSGGTTRRAAKMCCLDVDHPEIEKFIMWKYKEEQKVVDLVAGSKIAREQLGKIMEIAKKTNTDWKTNKELHSAMKNAMQLGVSINYIFRILSLVDQGLAENDFDVFDTYFESEAYSTVAGQNSNNSVRLSNSFLDAVKNKGKWQLINRTDGKVYKEIEAIDLWKKICLAAWHSADPGVQFDTTINEWHTCPNSGKINASNPCSEYMFLDNTACNLASINLVKFYDSESGKFDTKGFRHATRIATIVLEISVLMAQFVSPEMATLSHKFRSLGLGYANIGSLLMRMGLPYDNDEARTIIGVITAMLTGQAYATSAEMAEVLGAFNGFAENKEPMLKVIRNHRRAAYNVKEDEYEELTVKPRGIDEKSCPEYLLTEARDAWDQALELGQEHGYRNAQVTVLAPTGTIGLVMDCDTTGVEPDFAMVKFKKLVGGGYFKIVNQAVPVALKKLGYSKEEINDIINYAVGHGSLKECLTINLEKLKEKGLSEKAITKIEEGMKSAFDISFVFNKHTIGEEEFNKLGLTEDKAVLEQLGFSKEDIEQANEHVCGTMTIEQAPHLKEEHLPIFDCANKCGKRGKRFISYIGHIKAMAAAQPFISGAISKTINMDNKATIKDIETAYLTSWQYMIKANALYRDGSKLSQPLNTVVEDFDISMDENEDANSPEIVQARIMNNIKPLPPRRQGFTQEASIGGHPIAITTGEYDNGDLGEIKVEMYKDGSPYKALMNAFAKAISLGLQYGVPVEEMVEEFTFQGFDPAGMIIGDKAIKQASSPIDYIFRVLGIEYADRKDLAHVKDFETKRDTSVVSETDSKKNKSNNKELSEEQKAIREAKSKGYTGEACPSCGSMRLKRNGTCMLCEDCGSTTGCS